MADQKLDVVVSQTVEAKAAVSEDGFGFSASTTLEFKNLSREDFDKFQGFSMKQGAEAVAFASATFGIGEAAGK